MSSSGTMRTFVVIAVGAALSAPAAHGDWIKIEDFQGLTAGETLDGQNGWTVEGGSGFSPDQIIVTQDPEDPGNQVLKKVADLFDQEAWAWKDFGFTTDSVATLHYRWRLANDDRGPSDMVGLNTSSRGGGDDWWEYNARALISGGQHTTDDELLESSVVDGQWFNMWLVVDGAENTLELYRTEGDAPTEADLIVEGVLANPTTEGFSVVKTSSSDGLQAEAEGIYYDDFYIANDRTLTLIPEPGSIALLGLGAAGLLCRSRRPVRQ